MSRAAQLLVIELQAAGIAKLVEPWMLQHLVQPPIERMAWSFCQVPTIPEFLLPLTLSARSHRHNDTYPESSSAQSDQLLMDRHKPWCSQVGKTIFCW